MCSFVCTMPKHCICHTNVQKLSSHFSWVHEIIERQGRDGKEAVWRTMVEGSAPETINISESIGYK